VTALVPEISLRQFGPPPESLYIEKTVCVFGVVQMVGQKLQVVINHPNELTVL